VDERFAAAGVSAGLIELNGSDRDGIDRRGSNSTLMMLRN